MKKIFSIAIAALMLFAFVACGTATGSTANQDNGPIKIGGIGPLTGKVSQYGLATMNGAQVAIDELNAKGGILGRQVEFLLEDDKGEPTDAVNAYTKLVQADGVVAIVGAVTTKPTLAVAKRAADDNIPLITPSGSGDDITTIGANVFRMCFTDSFQGKLMAYYAQQVFKVKSVAVLYDAGNDYSVVNAEAFNAAAKELGIEITASEGYQPGSTDFNAQLTKIKEGNPEAIFLPAYYADVAQIVVQARALGIQAPFLGSDGWDGVLNEMDASNYSLLEGSIFCSQYSDAEASPALESFLASYREKYGEEMMFSVLGYESVMMLAAAMEKAGSTDANAVIAAMRSIEYEGLTGKISFPGQLNDPSRNAFMIGFKNGETAFEGTFNFQ